MDNLATLSSSLVEPISKNPFSSNSKALAERIFANCIRLHSVFRVRGRAEAFQIPCALSAKYISLVGGAAPVSAHPDSHYQRYRQLRGVAHRVLY